jgi:hypothetical protein
LQGKYIKSLPLHETQEIVEDSETELNKRDADSRKSGGEIVKCIYHGKKTCKWCGKEYDSSKSGSSLKQSYCSKRCELEAKGKIVVDNQTGYYGYYW